MSLIKIAFDIVKEMSNKAKKNSIKDFMTRWVQRGGLGGFANIESRLRKGEQIKDHKILKEMGGDFLTKIHALSGRKGKIAKKTLSQTIDNEGKYRIENIENNLKRLNKWHGRTEKIFKVPVTAIGLTGGGAIGYATGEEGNKKRSTLIGMAEGAAIGGSIRGGMTWLQRHPYYKAIPKVNKLYFEDNYWRKQLEKTNKSRFGNTVGKAVTKSNTGKS